MGVTPLDVLGLRVGRYEIALHKRDHHETAAVVFLWPFRKKELHFVLKELEGNLEIASDPSGAAILLDGRKLEEKTPATAADLAPGEYDLLLRLEKHMDYREKIVVRPGGTTKVKAKLKPIPSRRRPRKKKRRAKPCPCKGDKRMVCVPAGGFIMGCNEALDRDCEEDEKPSRYVKLDVYCIDKYEVTVAEYAECVGAGGCVAPDRRFPCNYGREDRAAHPVNCVTWEQANSYCRWRGKRLPTEEEWEKAARGTDRRVFPWGEAPMNTLYKRTNIHGARDGYINTAPVGSFPAGASPYGALDMAGNVWEWISDWHDLDQRSRSLRGGSMLDTPRFIRTSNRGKYVPQFSHHGVGFRCVR